MESVKDVAEKALTMIKESAAEIRVSDVIWEMLELESSNGGDISILQMMKIRQVLHPVENTNVLYVDSGVFEMIQKEASEMLRLFPDATDDKKLYWKSLVRGELPSRMVVLTKNEEN